MLPDIKKCYSTLPSMLRKFDRYARKDCFSGQTAEEFLVWQEAMRGLLWDLLGLKKMDVCPLQPVTEDVVMLEHEIRREHVRIQVEPDVWMSMYVLIPVLANAQTHLFLCPPGHNGAGKYTVAGCREYRAISERIEQYHYDYGYQLACMGYVTICPDSRGFGERRENLEDTKDPILALKNDCFRLAHMGEPLGIPVAGMLTWDLMRAVDYVKERGEWNCDEIGCVGFSGGGMQTLFLSALDKRIRLAVISGYLYGYRDALLSLNHNCSCNYIPHLWEHLDMGDIASLIAPRPLLIQSCREDQLNGKRGIANAIEQVEIAQKAYDLMGVSERICHEICEGRHQWHEERIELQLKRLIDYCITERNKKE